MIWWELVLVVDQLFCVCPVFKWLLVANSHVAEQVVSWAAEKAILSHCAPQWVHILWYELVMAVK